MDNSLLVNYDDHVDGSRKRHFKGWERDPCWKLHMKTQRKASHYFTVTQTPPGLSVLQASVHIPLLLFLLWTSAQREPFYAATLQRIMCHFFFLFSVSSQRGSNVINQFLSQMWTQWGGGCIFSPKIPTESHLIDGIALHPEVNNPTVVGIFTPVSQC